jgi:uncharacterized membrane protein required for colicin V production
MNALDIALIVVLVVPALIGLFKGLVNVAVAFVGLWLGFVVAGLFAPALASALEGWLGTGPLVGVVAYAALFTGTLLAAGLCGWLVTRSLKALDLQWVNRLAGATTGLACGLLLGGVLVGGWRTVAPDSVALGGSALAAPLSAVTSFVVAIPQRLEPAPGTPEQQVTPP